MIANQVMMKQFYLKIVFGSILGCLSLQAFTQLAPVPYFVETIVHNGNYGEANHDLTGYVTYRVYVQFDNPDNFLTSIFAAETPVDCIQDADSACFFDFPCGLFQHEFGSAYGFSESCLYPAIIPTSEWDSFLTIGQECASQANADFTGTVSQCNSWADDFEGPIDGNYYDGASFFWDETAIFSASAFLAYPQSLSHADANGRVLIGQFTTCGDMSGCINITYVDQNNVDQTEFNLCFEAQMPCLANGIDNIPDITSALCAGEASSLVLDGGGNGVVDYFLYTDANVLIESFLDEAAGLEINPITTGDYYITMEDEIGCRDTTAAFSITDPATLVFDATLLTDILCFGETTGSIELECSGGTGTIVIVQNGEQQLACGAIVQNLGCGSYDFVATDDNGCEASETIEVACPEEIVYDPALTNIECFGEDDGSIIGDVTGGTGNLTATWLYNTDAFDEIIEPSPLNANITNLDSGTYEITVTDENNCTLTDSFEITEPSEFSATYPVTDVTCFGLCDGTIIPVVIGGTGAYDIAGFEIGGGPVNLNALCEGEYRVTITDDNACVLSDTLIVAQPTDITYIVNAIPVTCFGQCDGQILLTEVDGSFGNFTYSISPNTGNCEAPCSGSSATYTDLCSGTFDILITDENGCPKSVDNVVISSPAAIQLVMDPTDVTCFGLSDGEVFIDVIGGTAPILITPSDSIAPATIGGLSIGTYTFTVTDANGCSAFEDVIIEQPDSLFATATSVVPASCGGFCDGRILYEVFGGSTPYDYQLLPIGSTGPVNGQISNLCSNVYELVIQDLFNCSDTLEFEILQPDPLVIDQLLNAPTCTGMFDGSAEIVISGGTGDLEFFIEPLTTSVLEIDSVTFNLSGLGEGEVYFELSDSAGCVLLDTLFIVPDIITDMVLSTFSTPETCWNEIDGTATVAVQNGFLPISYLWDDSNGQTTATASGLAPNIEYVVVVTDDIGCTLTTSVFVEGTEGCFFIATAITPNGDGVNDAWILGGMEFYTDSKINVYNRWGQNVFSSTGYNTQWDGTYQGQLLPVADYYFTIDYAPDKDVIMGTVTIKY